MLLSLLLCLPVAARVDDTSTRLSVDLGWDGVCRVGRWTPLFITLSHDRALAATIELNAPHTGQQGMRIVQPVTIGPTPTTFTLFFVPVYDLEQLGIEVRAADDGRLLAAQRPFDALVNDDVRRRLMLAGRGIVGVSGRPGWNGPTIASNGDSGGNGSLPIERLPDAPVGYDGLRVLILNAPDLNRLSRSQQQAIIGWVRAGGRLLFWADENAVPDDAPLLDVLPALVGPNTLLEIPTEIVRDAGLPDRFTRLRARALQPRPGAEVIDALSEPQSVGYAGHVGIGRVAVLPFDASLLLFSDADKAASFWSKVLAALGIDSSADRDTPHRYFTTDERAAGIDAAVKQIDTIEGAGSFDFGTIAWTLLGLMFVVGPIDWFVLKKLNRQPWTWATTTGWIGLITVASLYAGQLLHGGELHLCSVSVIEQIDGRRVYSSDVVEVYSPSTRHYELSVPAGWWQPLPGEQWFVSRGLREDYHFVQSRDGNAPLPLRVPIWSLRLLYGQRWTDDPPLIDARLSIRRDGETVAYSGTLRNQHAEPIELLQLECLGRSSRPAQTIAPGQTVTLQGVLLPPTESDRGDKTGFRSAMPELDDRQLRDGTHVSIHARFSSDRAVVDVPGQESSKRHVTILRAILPLAPTENP